MNKMSGLAINSSMCNVLFAGYRMLFASHCYYNIRDKKIRKVSIRETAAALKRFSLLDINE